MKIVFATLAAVFTILFVMVMGLYFGENNAAVAPQQTASPKYHVQVLAPNTGDHFWATFKDGALAAGEENNVYVEFVDVSRREADESVEAIEKAIYSMVDGVALQAADLKNTAAALDEAKRESIPAVTFENDFFSIPYVPTVGSNSYNIGLAAGEMAVSACGGKGCVAVLIDDTGSNDDSAYKNLKLQGIIDAFSAYPDMTLNEIHTLNSGMFEVDKITSNILESSDKVNVIICTDERSTPGVAQVIVDSNKVGDIQIVGFGAMEQTLNYIDRGVIYGTVCPDSYGIGYNTVKQLYSQIQGEQISECLYTDIFSVTDANLEESRTKLFS